MTQRFTVKPYDGIHCDIFDGDKEIAEVHSHDAKRLCGLLNYLNDEIESKQKVIDAYDNYIKTLKEDGVLE